MDTYYMPSHGSRWLEGSTCHYSALFWVGRHAVNSGRLPHASANAATSQCGKVVTGLYDCKWLGYMSAYGQINLTIPTAAAQRWTGVPPPSIVAYRSMRSLPAQHLAGSVHIVQWEQCWI